MAKEISSISIDIREDYLLKKITPEAKEGKAKEKLQELFKFIKDMKFDAVVGNPPYQETNENTSDSPVYHLFMDNAYRISDKVIMIHPARFLFNAGKTPKEWNNKIINDCHFKVLKYFSNSNEVFTNVDIKGGVAVTFRDINQKFDKIGVFTKFDKLDAILYKVTNVLDFQSIESEIFTQNKFDLVSLYKDYPDYKNIIGSNGKEKRLTTSIFEQLPIFTEHPINKNDLCIFGLIKNKRIYRFIPSKYIEFHQNTYKFKVILPKSNGSGALGEVISTPLIGEPITGISGIGYTQSFIGIGSFDSKKEAEYCFKYIKTKFLRAMLGVLKVTQDNNKEVWKFVPLQDFTENSDIDWSKSIPEIDQQLYAKYNLNEEEISFIESMIKPMN